MKKAVSIILTIVMLLSFSSVALAVDAQNYEYIMGIEYNRIDREKHCYIAYDTENKCAVYDLNGKKISEDYDAIDSFGDSDVALARRGAVTYVINYQGRVLSAFDKRVIGIDDYVFVNHSDVNNDGRPLSYFEGEFGVYTYNGELLKELSYDKFLPSKTSGYGITFVGRRLIFEENGKFGAIDDTFNTVIEPVFDKIYPFYNLDAGITIAVKNGKYGLIDLEGNTVADFVYDTIEPLYNGDINAYRVMQGESYMALDGEKYGLLDTYGNIIKTMDERVPHSLYENYNLIKVYKKNTRANSDEEPYLYGLMDFDGNIVIPIEHTDISHISEGIISAEKSYDHRGYYDLFGNEITEFKYRMASPFSEGLAFASSCIDGVWTHEAINNNGEVVFKPENWAQGFYGGIAHTETHKIIDKSGEIVIDNPEWEVISGLNWWDSKRDGIFTVSNNGKYGLVRYKYKTEEPVWDYDYIDFPNLKTYYETDYGYQFITLDGENIYLDLDGNVIEDTTEILENTRNEGEPKVDFEYEGELRRPTNLDRNSGTKYYKIKTENGEKLVDLNGKLVLEVEAGREISAVLNDKAVIVEYKDENDVWYQALIDFSGNVIIPYAEQHIWWVGGEIFSVFDNRYTRLVNLDGKVIAANIHYYTEMGDNGYIGISQDGFEGYITEDGKSALTLRTGYYVQGAFSEDLAAILNGAPVYSRYGDVGYINEQGELMLKPTDKTWCWGEEVRNGIFSVGVYLGKAGAQGKNLVKIAYDTPSDWAKEIVDNAIEANLVPEELQNRYRKNIDREDFCEIAYNLPMLQKVLKNGTESNDYFTDTDNKKVHALCAIGIIEGVGDNKFAPNEFITREEAATILKRICDAADIEIENSADKFVDDAYISDWASEAVYAMRTIGIMQGVSQTEFSPRGTYTKEQAITTMDRLNKLK